VVEKNTPRPLALFPSAQLNKPSMTSGYWPEGVFHHAANEIPRGQERAFVEP
jgi:hypothetical protein